MLIKSATFALCLFLSLTSAVSAQSKEGRLDNARRLISCGHFFQIGSKSTADTALRDKLSQLSFTLMTKAFTEILEANDSKSPMSTELAREYSSLGLADLNAFMDNVLLLPSELERNAKLDEFRKWCTSAIGVSF